MTQTAETINTPDYVAVKAKQQATWDSGDYGRIGVTLQITGESLCEAVDLRAGSRVLDVAGGTGNAALAAARRFGRVTCTDYVERLLQQCRTRAAAEGLAIELQYADAEDLPFADASFDNVVSTFGAMFAPNQARVASELQRVCKPGGKIGLANWTPDGFIGQLLKTVSGYVPPPAGVASPLVWGTKAFINMRFSHAASVQINSRWFTFRYESPAHWLDVFATYYGPTHKALLALDEERRAQLKNDILALIDRFNRAEDGTMVVPSSYLEIVVNK